MTMEILKIEIHLPYFDDRDISDPVPFIDEHFAE